MFIRLPLLGDCSDRIKDEQQSLLIVRLFLLLNIFSGGVGEKDFRSIVMPTKLGAPEPTQTSANILKANLGCRRIDFKYCLDCGIPLYGVSSTEGTYEKEVQKQEHHLSLVFK